MATLVLHPEKEMDLKRILQETDTRLCQQSGSAEDMKLLQDLIMQLEEQRDPDSDITIQLSRYQAKFFIDVFAISTRIRNKKIAEMVSDLKPGDSVARGNALAEIVLDLEEEQKEAIEIVKQLAGYGIIPAIDPFG